MPRIPDTDLERLKQNVNLAELCRARGIELKPNGRKDLIGLCPFHKETKPSFIVTPGKNLFHCMGCGAAGSVIDFVMKADGIDFRTAVDNLLACSPAIQRASSVLSVPSVAKAPITVSQEKASQLLERVVLVYEKTFAEAPEARAYLEQRGITDAGLYTCHRVGYANGKLLELLPINGTVRDELKAIGVLLDNGEERFKNCVVFPVYGPDGELVTIYGRRIEEPVGQLDSLTVGRSDSRKQNQEPRTKNQEPQTRPRHFYLPNRPTGMWNATAVKTHSEIILVESVIDALSVMMAGHRNVIAIQGTNGFDDTDLKTLQAHGVQSVTLLLDGDEPGIKAAERLKEKMASSFSCHLLTLPDALDPNAFLQTHGPENLARFLAQQADGETVSRSDGLTVRPSDCPTVPPSNCSTVQPSDRLATPTVTYGLRKYRIMGLEKGPRKLKATVRVEHAGKLHVDTLDFYAAKSRRIFAVDLCRIFEETPETIEGDIEKLLRHCEQLDESQISEVRNQRSVGEQISATERKEAEAFGKSATLFDDILEDCEKRGLMGERNNALLLYVAMTSRKRDVPLS
ncbi:MAG: CHC2 zinc finger domain-containing protein, partial [Magnetococcus sp. WYHC-3]